MKAGTDYFVFRANNRFSRKNKLHPLFTLRQKTYPFLFLILVSFKNEESTELLFKSWYHRRKKRLTPVIATKLSLLILFLYYFTLAVR